MSFLGLVYHVNTTIVTTPVRRVSADWVVVENAQGVPVIPAP